MDTASSKINVKNHMKTIHVNFFIVTQPNANFVIPKSKFYAINDYCKFGEDCRNLHNNRPATRMSDLEMRVLSSELNLLTNGRSAREEQVEQLQNAIIKQSDDIANLRKEIEKRNKAGLESDKRLRQLKTT